MTLALPLSRPLRVIAVAFMLIAAQFAAGLQPASALTAAEQAAIRVGEKLADQAHGSLVRGNLAGVQRAINQTFSFRTWEDFLIGNHGNKFTAAQRAEFRRLLPRYLARLYADQFSGGLDRKPEILGARTVRGDILVNAQIPRSNGRALKVDWRMRRIGGSYKVIDFMVGGVSFLLLKRDEFGTILQRDGADQLLAFLRKYTA